MVSIQSAFRMLLGARDVRRARRWHDRRVASEQAAEREALARFAEAFRIGPGPGRLVLARARDPEGAPFWTGVPVTRFLSVHHWICGGTGSGKSFLALAILWQVLARRIPVIVVDFKGELTTLLLDILLPVLTQFPGGDRLLERLRIVRPFSRYLPRLNLCLPEPGLDREIQAFTLASTLEESLGAELGHRMTRVLLRLVSLAIELGRPLTIVRTWLEDPTTLATAAQRSTDPSLRRYVETLRVRENRASIDALLARIDSFVFLPAVRRMLEAPDCVSFSDALDSGITIVDLGEPPAGAEQLTKFFGGVVLGKVMRSVLSRPVQPDSPYTHLVFEEFQEGLARHQTAQFARLLALARYKRTACTFINQQAAQLEPTLVRLLRTNTGVEAAFRCNLEDARAYAHAFPAAARSQHAVAERQVLVEQLTRLEQRQYLLWIKGAVGAQLVRSPRIDLDALRQRAAEVPADIRESIYRGTVAMDEPEAPMVAPGDDALDTAFLAPAPDEDQHHGPRMG